MDEDSLYKLALSYIPGVGNVTARALLSYCGSAKKVFSTPKGKLLKIPGIGEKTASSVQNSNILKLAEQEATKALKEDIELLLFTDKDFPFRLKQIFDSPIVLYKKGKGTLNSNRVLSVVGTRKATDYGKNFLEGFFEGISSIPQLTVVSGLAYGIDIISHRLALQHNIPTIGVMANGIDSVYPSSHSKTAHEMLEAGALLSENRIGAKPDAPKFPARNRIIAGMADGVLVVEAAEKGGALITAELGNDYDREVFAVPGNIKSAASAGCHKLIKEHKAHLVTSYTDVAKLLNWDDAEAGKPKLFKEPDNLSAEEKSLYDILKNGTRQIDDLAMAAQLPISKAASILLEMEFKGIVSARPGKKFQLK
jgi:DNA processing protein